MTSKLHLPGPGSAPLCGRQLNNHRASLQQVADKVQFTSTLEQFGDALQGKSREQACRHCARVAGLLPKLVRGPRFEGDEEDEQ